MLALPEAGQEREQVLEQRARTGRRGAGGAAEQRTDLGSSRPAQRRELVLAELAAQIPQRLDQRGVRHGELAELNATTYGDDEATSPGLLSRLGDQPRLADARITRDQDDSRLAHRDCVRRRTQRRQLIGPPDQLAAGYPASHTQSRTVRGNAGRGDHTGCGVAR
ncbi:MAG TPA: hypothetical protein VGJ38_11395, partial [Jatrophihabitantaceae bacterium]